MIFFAAITTVESDLVVVWFLVSLRSRWCGLAMRGRKLLWDLTKTECKVAIRCVTGTSTLTRSLSILSNVSAQKITLYPKLLEWGMAESRLHIRDCLDLAASPVQGHRNNVCCLVVFGLRGSMLLRQLLSLVRFSKGSGPKLLLPWTSTVKVATPI